MFFCNKLHHFKCIKESSESKESIEMVGWHHRLNGHGFGWTLEVADGWGGLACCSSWGCKELDMTERLNWTELSNDLSNSSNKSSVSHLYLKKKKTFYIRFILSRAQKAKWRPFDKWVTWEPITHVLYPYETEVSFAEVLENLKQKGVISGSLWLILAAFKPSANSDGKCVQKLECKLTTLSSFQ